MQLVVFRLDEQRHAIPLSMVMRVVRAVEITPLPRAPSIVMGAINVHGRVLPVLNLRRRLSLPERELRSDDQFLIVQTDRRTVVLTIDETEGLMEHSLNGIVEAAEIIPGLEQVKGVVKSEDGLVLIHDLERFLSLDEEAALDEAMSEEEVHAR